MDKPAHHRQNLAHQAARENKINRNLSPAFAKIQAQASKSPSEEKNIRVDSTQHSNETRPVTPSPTRTHQKVTDHTASERKTIPATPVPTLTPIASPPITASTSAKITPWLIASITLTLALFSGNYAWRTQQDVEKLNLRVKQLEAQTEAPPVTGLLDSSDTVAKTEQELLSLGEAQEQLAATIITLQSTLETGTEQAASRLTALEDTLADSNLQMQEATLSKEENQPPIAQTTEAETDNEETVSDSKTRGGANNSETGSWFINIASLSDPKAADNIYQKVHKITDKVSIRPITVNAQTLYRIRADGYSSRESAESEAQALQTQLNLSGLWISLD